MGFRAGVDGVAFFELWAGTLPTFEVQVMLRNYASGFRVRDSLWELHLNDENKNLDTSVAATMLLLLLCYYSYSGALADRICNFGNSQIEYFFGLPKWVNLGKAQNSQLEYFRPRRGPCS